MAADHYLNRVGLGSRVPNPMMLVVIIQVMVIIWITWNLIQGGTKNAVEKPPKVSRTNANRTVLCLGKTPIALSPEFFFSLLHLGHALECGNAF